MSEPKYTSGPWTWEKVASLRGHGLVGYAIHAHTESGKTLIASAMPANHPVAVSQQNAQLIATAPELLAAIEAIFDRQQWEKIDLDEQPQIIDVTIRLDKDELVALFAAIKKAKGG